MSQARTRPKPATLVKIGIVVVLIVVAAALMGNVVETVKKGTYQIKQAALSTVSIIEPAQTMPTIIITAKKPTPTHLLIDIFIRVFSFHSLFFGQCQAHMCQGVQHPQHPCIAKCSGFGLPNFFAILNLKSRSSGSGWPTPHGQIRSINPISSRQCVGQSFIL